MTRPVCARCGRRPRCRPTCAYCRPCERAKARAHWIWRQYASAFWDDVRVGRVLPYREAKDPEDEKHVHPLQLDVIDRALVLWSNRGETVLTPFMGVGSEVYGALMAGRRAIGIELKPSYFKQAKRNIEYALQGNKDAETSELFEGAPKDDEAL